MTTPAPSAIAIWPLVGDSYRSVFRHFPLLFRLGWVWLLLAWFLGVALQRLMSGQGGRTLAELTALPLLVAFAVAWHRASLIGARLPSTGAGRFGRREVRYLFMLLAFLAVFFLTFVLGGVVYLLASGAASATAAGDPVFLGVTGGLGLAVLFLGVRFILVFPAIAVGDQELTLRRSWELTRGNAWRLLLAFLASCLPLMLLKYAVVAAAGYALAGNAGWPGLPELAVLMPLFLVLDFLNTAAAVGFMSRAYAAFTGRRAIAQV